MHRRVRVETRAGWVEGRIENRIDADRLDEAPDDRPVSVFRSIPYARPPTGPLRWAPPQPEVRWSGVRDATHFGPSAPQRPSVVMRMLGMDGVTQDEDCLTLNVWTPAPDLAEGGTDGVRRPVLVWLHGGAFAAGAGSMPVYDGARLARRGDVVVVTIQYRLGALGYLVVPELLERGEVGANFGLLDQIAALAWVHEHAERLGGDPENVTVFGESAGAMSIGALLGAPAARGLFRRAILQSGATRNVTPLDGALRIAELFRTALGEDARDLDALRKAPVEAVLEAQQQAADLRWNHVEGLAFQPVCEGPIAGAILPRPPLDAVAAGDVADVALLVGTNLDEWRLFALADQKLAALDDEGLVRRILRAPPPGVHDAEAFARRAVASYRSARRTSRDTDPDRGAVTPPRLGRRPADARDLWLALQTDRVFRIPALRLLEAQLRHQPRCFAYLFTWAAAALDGKLGSCHAAEVPFVFGTLDEPRSAQLIGDTPAARRLSERIMDAWLAFARHGDPGWPAYDDPTRATMVLGRDGGVASDPLGAERRVWEGLL
ncbi:carboxylesterase family protein [Myxococcota bacterium]|nr:carboxylesterase family protein [Myxococcota bacterium]MCZ7617998.1 carboxylesterase family protein [Myxococcota bacterium]